MIVGKPLRYQQQRKQPTHYKHKFHHTSAGASYHKTAADMAPLSHAPQLSHSSTMLQKVDSCGSYMQMPAKPPPACLPGDYRPSCYHHDGGISVMGNHWHPMQSSSHQGSYCCLHQIMPHIGSTSPARKCVCSKVYQQKPLYAAPTTLESSLEHGNHRTPLGSMCYLGYERGPHWTEEEDSAFPALQDREFHMLHRNIPALRRTGVDTDGIRHYFYPEGGWGWIICGLCFLVHVLSTGFQLSYGLLLFYAVQHLHTSSGIEWLGALSWSISMIITPFVITYCRTKSARLLAVIGGLVAPLGILFTSFATELGQIVFSYGFIFSIGVTMIRESSSIMLGSYFKRRRKFVEMVAMSGEGVGIALFSVVLKEGVGEAGWRLGLQIIAALMSSTFFMGLLYRPASLYHPQRRAIQHLKNQHKKMRDNKLSSGSATRKSFAKYLCFDISVLSSPTARILLMSSGVAALGAYTPMFLMSLHAAKEGSDIQDLVLLQAFLGMSMVLGVVLAGMLMRYPFRIRQFVITYEVVSQVFISTIAIAILFLSFVMGYRGICILSSIYGIGFGGYRYSLKILALERIKLRQFSKAWGLIKGVEAIPVIISVPLTFFLNDYSMRYGRAGYYICSAAAAIGGIIIFFINYSSVSGGGGVNERSKKSGVGNGNVASASLHANSLHSNFRRPEMFKDEFMYQGCEYPSMDLLHRSCINLNAIEHEQPYMRRSSCYERSDLRPAACPYHHEHLRHHNLPQPIRVAHSGKRLQKSLSFIQNPQCWNGQWACKCYQNRSYCNHHHHQMQQRPLFCTCASLHSSTHLPESLKSRSVPEGLSVMSEQCQCRSPAALSRDIIYIQRRAEEAPHPYGDNAKVARHQALSKPVHFVEQITTSV